MIIRNSVANFLGLLLHPLLAIVLVPFYIHHLGLEGFGLVAFLTTLVTLLGIFTKGAGSALQREIALRAKKGGELQGLIVTFELSYAALGLVLALIFASLAPQLAVWLDVQQIPRETVVYCVLLIAVRVALAFPIAVYQAVFAGLEKQVQGNLLYGAYVLVSAVGGAVAVYATNSVLGLYVMEAVNALWAVVLFGRWTRAALPEHERSKRRRFEWGEIQRLWRLSAGLIWTNGIGLVVSQMDRVMIGRLLPLWNLGIYTAGAAGGQLVSLFYGAFLAAIYPTACRAANNEGRASLGNLLINNTKVTLIIAAAIGLPICFFSQEILRLWTRNDVVAAQGADVMSIYVVGNLMLSLASVLYQGQIALGVSRYGVVFNTLALIWFPIAMWLFISTGGLPGAATAWLIYCAASWMANVLITATLVFDKRAIWRYTRMITVSVAAGIAIFLVVKAGADYYFSGETWGRVLMAVVGSAFTALLFYLAYFGPRLPGEIRGLLAR